MTETSGNYRCHRQIAKKCPAVNFPVQSGTPRLVGTFLRLCFRLCSLFDSYLVCDVRITWQLFSSCITKLVSLERGSALYEKAYLSKGSGVAAAVR
jgi:hypothetical protein